MGRVPVPLAANRRWATVRDRKDHHDLHPMGLRPDLHLGALNSLLTNVDADGEHVDARPPRLCSRPCAMPPLAADAGPGPTAAGRSRAISSSWPLPPEDAAAAFTQFIDEPPPGQPDAAVSPPIRFIPGNHDHHLWSGPA